MKITKFEYILLLSLAGILLINSIFFINGVILLKNHNHLNASLNISNITHKEYLNHVKIWRILFGGDIMIGRGLDKYVKIYGYDYPFMKVQSLFSQIKWDIIYANLEGPIIDNAKPIKPFSFTFGFVPQVAQALNNVGFNLINIANNHITNYGYTGVISTRNYLKQNNIDVLGDNYDCNIKYSVQKNNIIFLGLNLVPPNNQCVEEMIATIKELKQNNKYFIIITPHWGIEYQQMPSNYQKEIAHKLIDNGADLIIGHHPHVIQSIEQYQKKLIFYSLGNLVFDQYFSQPTQQSLMIGLEYTPQIQTYYLFPLKSILSQLNYMSNEEEKAFLSNLASISSSEIKDMIQEGIIVIQ